MIRLTKDDAKRLAELLMRAESLVRDQAVDDDYRARGCKHVGDRTMAKHHEMRHEVALRVADEVADWREMLANVPKVEAGTRPALPAKRRYDRWPT